jgi:hypothetical protein
VEVPGALPAVKTSDCENNSLLKSAARKTTTEPVKSEATHQFYDRLPVQLATGLESIRVEGGSLVITTASNPDTRTVHDRMPVLLDRPDQIQRWLDLALEPEALDPFWTPAPSGTLHLRHVSARVNSPRHDGQDLIEPVETPSQSFESE